MPFIDASYQGFWQTKGNGKTGYKKMSTSAQNRSSNILLHAALHAGQKGMVSDSEKLFVKALNLKEKSVGKSTEYATILVSFADMYMDNGYVSKAEPLYAEALTLLAHSHGDDHLSIALLMRSLAEAYERLGKEKESFALCKQAKEILKQHRRCS